MYAIPESGPLVFGRKSIPIFSKSVTKQGAIFTVYEGQKEMLKAKEEIPQVKEERASAGEGKSL